MAIVITVLIFTENASTTAFRFLKLSELEQMEFERDDNWFVKSDETLKSRRRRKKIGISGGQGANFFFFFVDSPLMVLGILSEITYPDIQNDIHVSDSHVDPFCPLFFFSTKSINHNLIDENLVFLCFRHWMKQHPLHPYRDASSFTVLPNVRRHASNALRRQTTSFSHIRVTIASVKHACYKSMSIDRRFQRSLFYSCVQRYVIPRHPSFFLPNRRLGDFN